MSELERSNFINELVISNQLEGGTRLLSLSNEKHLFDMIIRGCKYKDILEELSEEIEKLSDGMLCSFLILDENGNKLRHAAAPSLPESYINSVDGVEIGPKVGSCGTAAYLKKSVIVSDISNSPLWEDYKDLALSNNLKACWSTPIFSSQNQVLGTFALYYSDIKSPNEYEYKLIEKAVYIASIAIEYSINFSKKLLAEKELVILNKITQAMNESYELNDIYKIALDYIMELEYVDLSCIYLLGENEKEAILQAHKGFSDEYLQKAARISYPKGITWKVIESGDILNVSDATKDLRVGSAGKVLGFKSMLGIPIKIRTKAIGVIWLLSFQKHKFTKQVEQFLTSIGNQIAISIARAKQSERLNNSLVEIEKKFQYEKALILILQLLGKSKDIDEVLQNAVEAIKRNIKRADNVGIYLIEDNNAVLKANTGFPDWFLQKVSIIPYPKGFTWDTIINKKSSYVTEIDSDDPIGAAGREVGTKSYVSMPLFYEGEIVGVININSYSSEGFLTDEMQFLERMKVHVETAINNATKTKVLKESEQRYRSFVENNADFIAETDLNSTILFANKSLCNFLGLGFYELQGTKINEYIHLDDTEKFESSFKQVKTMGIAENCEFRMIGDGKCSWMDTSFSLFKNDKNETVVLIDSRDISDRKKLEEEQSRIQRLDSLGILAGGIAHDFNNLVAIILGSNSLLDMSVDNNDENLLKYIKDIETAAYRAKDLTDQLLTFSKGGAPVKEVFADIGKLIKETAEFTLRGSKSKSNYDIDDELYMVEVDPGQISQVVQNLILNADQSMPSGGDIFISVNNLKLDTPYKHPLEKGRYIKISIKDSGCGIEDGNIDRIFDPYFTTKNTGNGLGLSTVYSIVKSHNGHIFVDSVIDKGSEFSLYFPITDRDNKSQIITKRLEKGNGRVLVMDDDPALLEVISNMLEFLGYRVTKVEDGQKAVNEYKKAFENGSRFDLVILDLTVPGKMSGQEALNKLVYIDPKVKSIVSSGYSNDPVLSDYLKYGFKGRVSKPYTIEDLSQEIKKVLDQ